MIFTPEVLSYGKESKKVRETVATYWELVLVKPHAPSPGVK